LIITRTPFRISFFGGGTDYPQYYREHGGAVLATTIDKYCYITCRKLPPFFRHKHRIVYSKIEEASKNSEIIHPSVREVLNYMSISNGLEIHHDGDLPARSGLGSSSSFTVGMLHALYAMQGKMITKEKLASDAIHVEQKMIEENVGSQDQISAAFGGFNKIVFHKNNLFEVTPVLLNAEKLQELESHLMLFFTGFSRIASEIAKSQLENLHLKAKTLESLGLMVDEGLSILQGNEEISRFGKLLHEGWTYKKTLSNNVSNQAIDDIYLSAIEAGAIGGKILGAGGGGFLLIFAKPENHQKIKDKLKDLVYVPFAFETDGSKVVLYQPNGL
jgi:D-glycero-alpha-D-manno-heptose-7-phosphate kinase